MNRRELFRDYIKKLNTTDPQIALTNHFYVPWPGTPLAHEMSERLSINPASSHLLYGSIGTGKTTQLLKIQEFLNQQPNTLALYVDVSRVVDLSQMTRGLLLGVLDNLLMARVQPWMLTELSKIAVQTVENRISFLRTQLATDVILLVDSLDRVTSNLSVLEGDIATLKGLGVGLVVAGSFHFFMKGNLPPERFDHVFSQYMPNPGVSSDALFLMNVLQLRVNPSILAEDAAREIVKFSGGVLRDLISLARSAGEEAYLQNVNQISPTHVATAARRFGEALMMGFAEDDLNKLRHIKNSRSFHPSVAREQYFPLQTARCILEYSGSVYKVHPVILSLLDRAAA